MKRAGTLGKGRQSGRMCVLLKNDGALYSLVLVQGKIEKWGVNAFDVVKPVPRAPSLEKQLRHVLGHLEKEND